MKKHNLPILLFAIILISCGRIKHEAKDAVNKTGEIAGKAGSEFVSGVSTGVQKTFENEIDIADSLKQNGLKTGKIIIASSKDATDNVLSVYFIFDKDFNKKISLKLFDKDGQEYGRVSQYVQGKKDEAKYVDFVFDTRTVIDSKGKIVFE